MLQINNKFFLDVVRDTTDTDSKSDCSEDEYEVHYEEYEVASLSGSENGYSHSNSSSDSEVNTVYLLFLMKSLGNLPYIFFLEGKINAYIYN